MSILEDVLATRGLGEGRNIDDVLKERGVPKDIIGLLAREYVKRSLEDAPKKHTCFTAATLMRMASRWGTVGRLLDTDDSIWESLFVRDFLMQYGERTRDWTENRSMPWKSAYLWTVFLRRRCLRALVDQLQWKHAIFKAIPFGEPGCVCAMEHWVRMNPSTDPEPALMDYCVVSPRAVYELDFKPVEDLVANGTLSDVLEGRTSDDSDLTQSHSGFVSYPGEVLLANMRRVQTHHYIESNREQYTPLRTIFADNLVIGRDQVYARRIEWNLADALYAYCTIGRYQLAGPPPPIPKKEQAIFDCLPDYPTVGGQLFLGAQVK